jgi:hypothetical protein
MEDINIGQAMVRITVVNFASIDIACESKRVWRDIVEAFVEGRSLSEQGYLTERLLDDPSALLGGYRVLVTAATGELTDASIVRITELDEDAMRLSLNVHNLIPRQKAMNVNVSSRAIPIECGTRYETHLHTNFNAVFEFGGDLATTAAEFKQQTADFLSLRLAAMKARLETPG